VYRCSSKQGSSMEVQELETYQIGPDEKHYVLTRPAAKYLHISHDRLIVLVELGKIEAIRFGSRQFIELETLNAYAEKRKPKVSGWDRLDEWKG
jgi:excisionase family DNA binding protein